MQRAELWEWIILILCIILWWPRIFWGFDALLYHILIYYLVPVALLIIFIRRYVRMKEGLKYSEEAARKQPLPPGPPPN